MNKDQFLNSIQEGKWFEYKNQYGAIYAVKMKEVLIANRNVIYSLWLSHSDPEGMSFSEYLPTDWDWIDGSFVDYSAGVYHFGGTNNENPGDDDIYDENTGELLEDKMRSVVLGYAMKDFLTEEEFDGVWDCLKNNKTLGFDKLDVK